MQPGRGAELLHVSGDSLSRALWWGCEEAPPHSGEDMCFWDLHMSRSSGARSVDLGSGATPLRRGGDTNVPWCVGCLWITDLRVTDYITNSLYIFMKFDIDINIEFS